ncbi:MAG: hypothetical protein LBC69_01955, partial [Eubacteriaceae bacterium]|nr:hypothetical protein [Eubacteriaceae bacterium]
MRRPHKKNAPLIKMAKPLLRIALSIFALATGISTAGAVDAVSLSATGQTSVAAGSYSDASAGITQLTGNGVGGFDKGEWVEYRLDALRTASYRFSLVMGSTSRDQSQGGAFEVFLNAQATASMSVSLGNAQGGSDAPAFLLRLFEGVNTIRLRAETPIADTLERLLVESAGIEGLAATLSPAKAERIEYGNPASFMCAVQSDGKPVSGSAVFAVDGKKSMPISLDAQGKAIFEASGLAAGKHTIAALYEGSAGTVQSNAVTFDIAKAVPVAPRTDSIGTHVAQYGQKLSDIKLKEGYRWENPSQMVGDASGEARLFTCLYNPDPANYFDCPFSIGIQVRKREVTLRAVNKEKTAGAGDPKLTIDVVNGSILPGDTIQGSLTYTGTRIGAYSIVEGEALFNENYDIEFVPGTIKINPTEKMKGFLDSIAALPSINTIADADKAVEIYRLY